MEAIVIEEEEYEGRSRVCFPGEYVSRFIRLFLNLFGLFVYFGTCRFLSRRSPLLKSSRKFRRLGLISSMMMMMITMITMLT